MMNIYWIHNKQTNKSGCWALKFQNFCLYFNQYLRKDLFVYPSCMPNLPCNIVHLIDITFHMIMIMLSMVINNN